MKSVVFLTGGSGFVGQNLIPRIMKDPEAELVLLLRAANESDAMLRLRALLASLADLLADVDCRGRISCVRGDVTAEGLGMEPSVAEALAARVTHVIHCAASVDFCNTIERAREINVEGTRRVMAFAMRAHAIGALRRVVHMSTAYVSGARTGMVYEARGVVTDRFSNAYERSKYEADRYVQALMPQLPIAIVRPSIVVGDARTGRITSFNGLYSALKMISRGMLRVLPDSFRTPIDVVSVDYVAEATVEIALRARDVEGRIFHLVAGTRCAPSVGEVVSLAVSYFNEQHCAAPLPRVMFLPEGIVRAALLLLRRNTARVLQRMMLYKPYLSVRRIFDDANTRAVLAPSGIAPRPFREYHRVMLEYCTATNWGHAKA
jgi:long-chain acyl-CoA synthetase